MPGSTGTFDSLTRCIESTVRMNRKALEGPYQAQSPYQDRSPYQAQSHRTPGPGA
jgi:hypothetical protein